MLNTTDRCKSLRIRPFHDNTGMRGKFVFLLSIVCVTGVRSQSQPTLGMLTHTAGSLDNGYILFAPTFYGASYLVDKCGKLVHSWPSSNLPYYPVYLLDDGSILRPETSSGTGTRSLIKRISWDGNVQWHYAFGDSNHQQHHDIQPLPNGNVLVLMTDMISKADAVAAGRDSLKALSTIGSEELVEYQPVG